MKRIKSYTGIWNVEKVLYAVGDVEMPFPATYTQIAWAVGTLCVIWMFSDVPPFSLMENPLLKWVCIPVGTAWFMSKKAFDGKKPYRFLKSAVSYLFRPKQTYAGKKVTYRKIRTEEFITAVRREVYVPN